MKFKWIPGNDGRGSAVLESSENQVKVTLEGESSRVMPLLEIIADYIDNQSTSDKPHVPLLHSRPQKMASR